LAERNDRHKHNSKHNDSVTSSTRLSPLNLHWHHEWHKAISNREKAIEDGVFHGSELDKRNQMIYEIEVNVKIKNGG
jgi:hypothetical protein